MQICEIPTNYHRSRGGSCSNFSAQLGFTYYFNLSTSLLWLVDPAAKLFLEMFFCTIHSQELFSGILVTWHAFISILQKNACHCQDLDTTHDSLVHMRYHLHFYMYLLKSPASSLGACTSICFCIPLSPCDKKIDGHWSIKIWLSRLSCMCRELWFYPPRIMNTTEYEAEYRIFI